ncbi:HAD family hydrolase [Parvularcula marina]|uniref:HAD family hydrolase n=1 Tax=Parvularcula marina TaxID=2292771 RepID=A0A371RLK9_9PROT|nr:HAD family hydrolase [Parvularcula marina]RFB06304.1 HAD family hydrolase [Parvularcula marina]
MTRRIAMWSGPRNISTTMMRSFENRSDTAVTDEPFYAHYLTVTGLDHPMRDEVLTAQPTDWRVVAEALTTEAPAPVWFQKHMTQHMMDEIDLGFMSEMQHFFLIRDPRLMAASFAKKMNKVTAEDLGLARELALFRMAEKLTGTTPAVIDAQDVLRNPEAMLRALCDNLDLEFDPGMLNWPAGPRDSDGVWAPHWYDAVHSSTGFGDPVTDIPSLTGDALSAALASMTPYKELYKLRLTA